MNVTNPSAGYPKVVGPLRISRRGALRKGGLVQVAGFLRSSVGQKWLMAGSGAVLFGWLVLHLAGNLTAFSGARAFDGYAASLRRSGRCSGLCAARCSSRRPRFTSRLRSAGAARAGGARRRRVCARRGARGDDRVAQHGARRGAAARVHRLSRAAPHDRQPASGLQRRAPLPQPRERAGDGADGGAVRRGGGAAGAASLSRPLRAPAHVRPAGSRSACAPEAGRSGCSRSRSRCGFATVPLAVLAGVLR